MALVGFFLGLSLLLGYSAFCLVSPVGILYRNVLLASTQGTVGPDVLAMPVLVVIEIWPPSLGGDACARLARHCHS